MSKDRSSHPRHLPRSALVPRCCRRRRIRSRRESSLEHRRGRSRRLHSLHGGPLHERRRGSANRLRRRRVDVLHRDDGNDLCGRDFPGIAGFLRAFTAQFQQEAHCFRGNSSRKAPETGRKRRRIRRGGKIILKTTIVLRRPERPRRRYLATLGKWVSAAPYVSKSG